MDTYFSDKENNQTELFFIKESEKKFDAEKRWFCDKPNHEEGDNKVTDHCQITGEKRGAAHTHCNRDVKQRCP